MHPGSLPLAMRVVRFSVSPSCSRPVVVVVLLLLLCPLFLHPWPDPACYVMHTTPRRDNITSSIVITITTTTICNTYVIQIPQARSSFRPSTNEQARSATPAHPSPSPRRLGVLLDDGRGQRRGELFLPMRVIFFFFFFSFLVLSSYIILDIITHNNNNNNNNT